MIKLVITEHERGWGQRDSIVKYKDNELEKAKKQRDWINNKNNQRKVPDIYWTAKIVLD
jgi:hypothetical protein